MSSSGMGGDVHSLILSIQHFLCRPRHRPPSTVPQRMGLERLSLCVTCLNHAGFRLLTVARGGSSGPTRKLILFRTVIGLVFLVGDAEMPPKALGFESLDPLFRVNKQGPCFTAIEKDV